MKRVSTSTEYIYTNSNHHQKFSSCNFEFWLYLAPCESDSKLRNISLFSAITCACFYTLSEILIRLCNMTVQIMFFIIMMYFLLRISKYDLIDKMVFGAEFKKCANKLLATKKDIKVKRAGITLLQTPFFTFSKSTYISQIKWPLTKLRWLLSRNIFLNSSFTFFKANGQLSKCWSKKMIS